MHRHAKQWILPDADPRAAELRYRRWSLKAFVAAWLLLGFPVPVLHRRWSCRGCGQEWREDQVAVPAGTGS